MEVLWWECFLNEAPHLLPQSPREGRTQEESSLEECSPQGTQGRDQKTLVPRGVLWAGQ